jgi:hypothetical protein
MAARLQHLVVAAWRLARSYPYLAVALPVVIGLSIPFFTREDSEWEAVYVVAATHLRSGEDIYRDGNSYPPFAAFVALPWSFLPPAGVRGTWLLVNLASLAVMLRGAWRLAGGGALQGSGRGPLREQVAAVLGFACGAGYLLNCLAHQQNDVVIGAVLVVGCVALGGSRWMTAATCFGIAAAVKCTALLWCPYLVWRGRPAAAVWLVVLAVGVNLLPDLVSSPPSGGLWLGEYVHRYLQPLASREHVAGTWGSDIIYNQSIAGAAQRWLVADRERPMRPELLRAVVLGLEAVLVAATLWVCGAPFRMRQRAAPGGVDGEAVEYGIVLILMLLLSPMSSKAHFGALLLPGFLLARAAANSGSRLLWGLVALAAVLGSVSQKDLLGEQGYTLTLWYGTTMWEAVVLLAGCLCLAWHSRPSRGGRKEMAAAVAPGRAA